MDVDMATSWPILAAMDAAGIGERHEADEGRLHNWPHPRSSNHANDTTSVQCDVLLCLIGTAACTLTYELLETWAHTREAPIYVPGN